MRDSIWGWGWQKTRMERISDILGISSSSLSSCSSIFNLMYLMKFSTCFEDFLCEFSFMRDVWGNLSLRVVKYSSLQVKMALNCRKGLNAIMDSTTSLFRISRVRIDLFSPETN